jgi:CcdB protein
LRKRCAIQAKWLMARAGVEPQQHAVRRHRVRGVSAPYLLVLQHPIVDSQTRICAPVVPARGMRATLLTPGMTVGGAAHLAMLLDMAAVPLRLIAAETEEVAVDASAISAALDAIFSGYPVGLPSFA